MILVRIQDLSHRGSKDFGLLAERPIALGHALELITHMTHDGGVNIHFEIRKLSSERVVICFPYYFGPIAPENRADFIGAYNINGAYSYLYTFEPDPDDRSDTFERLLSMVSAIAFRFAKMQPDLLSDEVMAIFEEMSI